MMADANQPVGEVIAVTIGIAYFIGVTFLVPFFMLSAADKEGPDGILGLEWYCESPRTARYKLAVMVWLLAFALLWPLFLLLIFCRSLTRKMDKNFGKKRRERRQGTSGRDLESATSWVEARPDSRASTAVGAGPPSEQMTVEYGCWLGSERASGRGSTDGIRPGPASGDAPTRLDTMRPLESPYRNV